MYFQNLDKIFFYIYNITRSICVQSKATEGENAISNPMFGWLPDYSGEGNIALLVDFKKIVVISRTFCRF